MATKKLKQLTDWDWTTLVAAWRYYQYRSTIVSATFPRDIYERYFMGEYAPEDCRRIAYQFYSVDHGSYGEMDWQGQSEMDWQGQSDMDANPWTAFFAFCQAYCEGFSKLRLKDGSIIEAFYHETSKRWIPRKRYRGDADVSIADDRIVKVESEVRDEN